MGTGKDQQNLIPEHANTSNETFYLNQKIEEATQIRKWLDFCEKHKLLQGTYKLGLQDTYEATNAIHAIAFLSSFLRYEQREDFNKKLEQKTDIEIRNIIHKEFLLHYQEFVSLGYPNNRIRNRTISTMKKNIDKIKDKVSIGGPVVQDLPPWLKPSNEDLLKSTLPQIDKIKAQYQDHILNNLLKAKD